MNNLSGFNCLFLFSVAITTGRVVDCSGVIDLAFVLHSAGTVHAERWTYLTQFVSDIISELDVHPARTRVAVVYWSDTAYVAFPLDRYNTRQDVAEVRPMSDTQQSRTTLSRKLSHIIVSAGNDFEDCDVESMTSYNRVT